MNIIGWFKLARESGYDVGFRHLPNRPLRDLELLGLIEHDPTSRGPATHWRITQKGLDFKPG